MRPIAFDSHQSRRLRGRVGSPNLRGEGGRRATLFALFTAYKQRGGPSPTGGLSFCALFRENARGVRKLRFWIRGACRRRCRTPGWRLGPNVLGSSRSPRSVLKCRAWLAPWLSQCPSILRRSHRTSHFPWSATRRPRRIGVILRSRSRVGADCLSAGPTALNALAIVSAHTTGRRQRGRPYKLFLSRYFASCSAISVDMNSRGLGRCVVPVGRSPGLIISCRCLASGGTPSTEWIRCAI